MLERECAAADVNQRHSRWVAFYEPGPSWEWTWWHAPNSCCWPHCRACLPRVPPFAADWMNISAVTIIACISLPKVSWPAAAAAAAAAHSALQPSAAGAAPGDTALCPQHPDATSADVSCCPPCLPLPCRMVPTGGCRRAAAGAAARGVCYSSARPPLLPFIGQPAAALLGPCLPPRLQLLRLAKGRGCLPCCPTRYCMLTVQRLLSCITPCRSDQFVGWTGADWAVLVSLGCFCFLGAGVLAQLAVWFLGASTVAMLVGLRLVLAIGLSKASSGAQGCFCWAGRVCACACVFTVK